MYEDMWKKDWSEARSKDAELFIKEAFDNKPKRKWYQDATNLPVDSLRKSELKQERNRVRRGLDPDPYRDITTIVGLSHLGAIPGGLAYGAGRLSGLGHGTSAGLAGLTGIGSTYAMHKGLKHFSNKKLTERAEQLDRRIADEFATKEAFTSPLAVFGNVAPGAYLGTMSGRNLGGELAHEIAPRGHKTKSKERARNIAVPVSAAGAIAGGLMQPGKYKVHGALLRNTSMSPSDIQKIMKYGYPSMAGLAAGTAAGLGTGAVVGGYHRLKGEAEKTASASSIRNKIIGGAAALGALGLGGHEYMKGKTLPSGVTQRQAETIARQAQDSRYEELTGKKRAKLVRFLDEKNEQLGQKMDENRKVAVPAKAVLGGVVGGYSAKKALDFVKNNARLL